MFYKSVLEYQFTSIYPWTPKIFLKKHYTRWRRCTLLRRHTLGRICTAHWLDTRKLVITLFSRFFTGERTIGYISCDSTEHRGQRLEQWAWLASCPMLRWKRWVVGIHVWYYDTGLKWLAVCMCCMVSAEVLNCKLLSTQTADIKHLYFT
jgi:hypothetical protein